MLTSPSRCVALALIALAAPIVAGPAAAQGADRDAAEDAVAQFYHGKQVTLTIGSSAGGGYDTYGRLLARYLGRYIPGNPSVVPQNMPGAGSAKLAAYIDAVAPKDGTAIGAIFPGVVMDPLLGNKEQVKLDPSKLIYLGSATTDVYLCAIRSDAPVKSFADALSTEVILGASAEGASTRNFPALLDNIVGAKFRLVTGYPGSHEILLAMQKGEVQGLCGMSWSSLSVQHPDWLSSGFVKPLAQEHAKGHPAMNKMGVPLTVDFAKTEQDRQAMELVYTQEIFGRPYVLPPGTPADRVGALRRAFMEALRDKDLLADAARMRLDLDPVSGEDLQALVAKIYSMPDSVIQRAKNASIYKPTH